MKKLLLLLSLLVAVPAYAGDRVLCKYNTACTINFELYEVDGVDFRVDAVCATGDVLKSDDEGAEASTGACFTDEGSTYSYPYTCNAARCILSFIDQTATKVWLDKAVIIETYGNASAQHGFDLDLAEQLVALSATGKTDVNTEADAAMVTYGLDHLISASAAASDIADDSVIALFGSKSGTADFDDFDNTTDSLNALGALVTNDGTAQAGASTSITLATSAATTADYYNGQLVLITGGTGAGQSRQITDYSTGRVATVAAWAVDPDNTSTYVLVADITAAAGGAASCADTWDCARSSHTTTGTFGESVNLGNRKD